MDQDAPLIRLAVLGSPVKHSLSPWVHSRFAEQAGIPVDYRAIEVDEEHLSRAVQQLADDRGRGCNITLPHKEQAYRLASHASERATLAGSANTLVFESQSRWQAENTDGSGLLRDLRDNLGLALRGQALCLVGAGGAAAGIIYDLLLKEPASLTLVNRTPGRAAQLAERFSPFGEIRTGGLAELGSIGPFDLVIHASAAGHHGTGPVLADGMFAADGACYDLNYGDAHVGLASWCAARGIRCYDGLGMLAEQAAESFRLWTGFSPDTAPVIRDLRERAG